MAEPITGGTEKCYVRLAEHYQFPPNVFVSHLPEELRKSDHPYKILWAHHAFDQPLFLNFDHNLVNHIVSPSEWNKEMFVKFHNVPADKITVIPVGIYDIFTHSANKTKTMIHTSIPYKGLAVLSQIIPRILERHPDTKFKIFSSMSLYGPLNDPYIELYEELKLNPSVEYSSAVTQDELVKHYQESAFFVHPNIWEETFCQAMCEAMRCGAYPIITNIGALAEVAGQDHASVVPIEGKNTTKGWEVTENFLNNFTETCCKALDFFDKERPYYDQVSKNISDYIVERYNWKTIAHSWKTLIHNITGDTMTTDNSTALTYNPINAQQAVNDEEYLRLAFDNVLRWDESDREMAQGRTNFQLEKFIGLNTHNISVSFEHILKERRGMATGYMYKLIEMKEKVREFEYKWNDKDKSKPIMWEQGGPGGGHQKLCWYDLDELSMTHYLKSSELEIRDRLHQMEHLDKMLDALIERNGGKIPDREQFLAENENYWDTRLAEQALDDLMAAQTGISGGNLQAMRRASGPSIVDGQNELKEGYLPMDKLLTQEGRLEFIQDLQSKVLKGYEKLSGKDMGQGTLKAAEEQKQLGQSYFNAGQGFKEE